jgi:serine/threonine protein kinase
MSKTITLPKREIIKFGGCYEFEIQNNIGIGAFGKVFKAIHKTSKKTYALKVLNLLELHQIDGSNLSREIINQKEFEHLNIVKFYDYFVENNKLYFVLEFLDGGNLFHLVYGSTEIITFALAQKIIKHVLLGLSHMHNKNYIQRDIKLENILTDKNRTIFKICDFGWSSHVSDINWLQMKGGTLAYMSPEGLQGYLQTKKVDIWAVGVLLYELIFKKEPFKSSNNNESTQLKNILYNNLDFPLSVQVPSSIPDFIKKCLNLDPAQRPSVDDL